MDNRTFIISMVAMVVLYIGLLWMQLFFTQRDNIYKNKKGGGWFDRRPISKKVSLAFIVLEIPFFYWIHQFGIWTVLFVPVYLLGYLSLAYYAQDWYNKNFTK